MGYQRVVWGIGLCLLMGLPVMAAPPATEKESRPAQGDQNWTHEEYSGNATYRQGQVAENNTLRETVRSEVEAQVKADEFIPPKNAASRDTE